MPVQRGDSLSYVATAREANPRGPHFEHSSYPAQNQTPPTAPTKPIGIVSYGVALGCRIQALRA